MERILAEQQTDSRLFRELFRRFTTGVAIVGIQNDAEVRGVTVNSLTAVSLDPMLLLFCIATGSGSIPSLKAANAFSVNLLAAGQVDVSRHYAGAGSKSQDWRWISGSGAPILDGANACFDCRLNRMIEAGDHYIVIGEVGGLYGPESPDTPLLYHGGRYAELAYAEDEPGDGEDPADFWWTG